MPRDLRLLAVRATRGPRPMRAHSARLHNCSSTARWSSPWLVITSAEVKSAAIVVSAAAHAVYTFDRDQVTLNDVHNPVRANPQPVIVAAVEPFSRIRSAAKPATAAPMARMPS